MIPKFLICWDANEPDLEFVLHTDTPRFLAQVFETELGTEIRPVQEYEKWPTETTAQSAASLMREMGDWYAEQQLLDDEDF